MDDADAMRLMVIEAVNECTDLELLDLIYRILRCDANTGGENIPAFISPPRSKRHRSQIRK